MLFSTTAMKSISSMMPPMTFAPMADVSVPATGSTSMRFGNLQSDCTPSSNGKWFTKYGDALTSALNRW